MVFNQSDSLGLSEMSTVDGTKPFSRLVAKTIDLLTSTVLAGP